MQSEIPFNQFRPLDPRFHLQDSAFTIQLKYAIQLSDIDQQGIGAELLPTHRVPPARNRDCLAIFPGGPDDGLHFFLGSRPENCLYPSGIELGMNIVD